MPFRTRDYLLYLLAGAFLVIAIFVTALGDSYPNSTNVATVISVPSNSAEVVYTATVEEKPAMDRAGHLANLRSKIAEFKETISGSNPMPEPVPVQVEETTEEEPTQILSAELKCPLYQNFTGTWSPKELNFSVVEGARLLYREVEISNSLSSSSSSTTASLEPSKEVILQLPLQSYPATEKSCLPTDVVGVAVDGSLIKNNEFGLYSIFGAETLVGYALDGFPIYGQAEVKTDGCGGIFAAGQYRYYLSSEREAVIYCYSGTPVEI